ncbi:MAG: STAS/SEC14 domain-containing protein [Chthoniobacteraceae bacterium]
MPVTIEHESKNVCVLGSSGMVKRSEFTNVQATAARAIEGGAQPRILAILEDFQGWEIGADWNDLDFQLTHGNEIAKIAIVGEPRWEPDALAFAGAGFRRAPVRFFLADQEVQARAWLRE